MTDHKQAAIEALQHTTLTGKRQLTPAQAKECVEGAIPHIRAMIAQEILDSFEGLTSHGLPYRDGIFAGLTTAAQIAKGPQQ